MDEESACIDGFPKFGLAADHFAMHRYSGPTDGNFRLVRGELCRFAETSHERLDLRADVISVNRSLAGSIDQKDKDCLNAIFVSDPREDLEMIETKTDKLVKESNDWILSNPSWVRWLNEHDQSLLWIHGDPGKGKTFISIAAVRELSERRRLQGCSQRDVLLYYFCDKKDDRKNNALAIMQGLLHQLLSQRPDLVYILRQEYERRKGNLLTSPTALHTMFGILCEAAKSEQMDNITIVVDALDECSDSATPELLLLIAGHQDDDEASSETGDDDHMINMKWLFTSRNEEHIRHSLCDVLDISLEDNAIEVGRSVTRYIDVRVSHLRKVKRYPEALAKDVHRVLEEKAGGTFLWVALACRELLKPQIKSINTRAALAKLPAGLKPLYDRILDQVLAAEDAELAEFAKSILRTMAFAFRPLSLIEIAIAARLPVELDEDPRMTLDYLELCNSIVSVRDDTAHFVHESAQAYVRTRQDVVLCNEGANHAEIAAACYAYLSIESPEHDDYDTHPKSSDGEDPSAFPTYPVLFWLEHCRLGTNYLVERLTPADSFWDHISPARETWLDRYWPLKHAHWEQKPSAFSAIHCLAYAGHTDSLKAMIDGSEKQDLTQKDSLGNDALIWASLRGWSDTVEFLLEAKSDVTVANKAGLTALCLAANHGHLEVVKALVKAGAEVNHCDLLGTTMVHKVATQGHIPILHFLVDSGAKVDGRDHLRWTPIQTACSGGHLKVVKALKERGADLTQIDREGMSLLRYAASQGHTDVATYLLKNGVSINSKCYEQWTPLHEASWSGEDYTVAYLLKHGADTRQRNQEGHTPLHQAAWNGHSSVVNLLLNTERVRTTYVKKERRLCTRLLGRTVTTLFKH